MKLATAYYELIPSTAGAQGEITREFTGIGQSASKSFGGSFTRGLKATIGPAITLLGAASVGKFLKDSVGEAREAQKVGALTNNVIKQTGGIANISAKGVGRLSSAISNKTGMDDEAIQSGANLLLTFKNVRNEAGKGANVFDRATAAAADLSAAGFGDLNGASKQLGKALNDPVKGIAALGRSGVTFTQQQKDTIKTMVAQNDILGAQKIILGEVESQVGGAAAASSTLGEKASVAFGNFKESIGTALLPVIDDLSTTLIEKGVPAGEKFADFFENKAVPAIREFATEAIPLAKSTLPAIGTALSVAADAAKVLAPAVKSIVDSFNSLPKGVQTAIVLGGGAAVIGSKVKGGLGAAAAGGAAAGAAKKGGGPLGVGAALAGTALLNTKNQVDVLKRINKDMEDSSGRLSKTLTKDGTSTKQSYAAIRKEFEAGRVGKYASDLGVDLDKLSRSFAHNGLQGKYVQETLSTLDGKYSKSKDIADDAFGHLIGETESSKIAGFTSSLKSLGDQYTIAGDKAYRNGNQTRDLTALMLGNNGSAKRLAKTYDELGSKRPAPKVTTPGLGAALGGVTGLSKDMDRLDRKVARPQVFVGGGAGAVLGSIGVQLDKLARKATRIKVGANARGTDDWRGGLSIVGEKGPELVNLPKHSQVLPADLTRSAMSRTPAAISAARVGGSADSLSRDDIERLIEAVEARQILRLGQRDFQLAVADANHQIARKGGRS